MKKFVKAVCTALLLLLVIQTASIGFTAFACGEGTVYVNGEAFDGTVAEAIVAAGVGGTVGIGGTVYTEPIGKRDGSLVTDITISGVGDDAKLILTLDFKPKSDDNLDVLTIKGSNVTVKDLTIDARFFVDYPICVFCYTDNISIDNVTVLHGIRGGVNVMTGGNVLFRDVCANDTKQAGFVFENCGDASNIRFENCSTKGNFYHAGLIVKNGYGADTNIDATGLTCYENCFAFHDRVKGTIWGDERADLSIKVPPLNSKGERISLDYGVYYPLEQSYQHIRFGEPESEARFKTAKLTTSKYGFETVIYYDDLSAARATVIEGDSLDVITVKFPIITAFKWLFTRIECMISLARRQILFIS